MKTTHDYDADLFGNDGTDGWTASERQRRQQAELGRVVVANRHRKEDAKLLQWAEQTGRAVDVMRPNPLGNEFVIGRDGGRDEVLRKFWTRQLPEAEYQAHVRRIRPGSVLVCCCHPLPCHGDMVAAEVNRQD
jgi:hypothetical protein